MRARIVKGFYSKIAPVVNFDEESICQLLVGNIHKPFYFVEMDVPTPGKIAEWFTQIEATAADPTQHKTDNPLRMFYHYFTYGINDVDGLHLVWRYDGLCGLYLRYSPEALHLFREIVERICTYIVRDQRSG